MLLFLIFGLSIYITALSIAFDLGFGRLIGIFQSFKEVIIITLLSVQIWTLKRRIHLHFIDYAVIAYFCYTLLYALFPIGDQGLFIRLIAFKSLSFFSLVYFCGRLFEPHTIYINKYFHWILYLAIAAAVLAVIEYSTSQFFQTYTGYSDFYYYVYNLGPSGAYGLTYTFETDTGLRRLASFFANPLEHAAATILALAVLASLYTGDDNKIKSDAFGKIVFACTLISIMLAVSRASFLNYFLVIYVYAFLTRNKFILNSIHLCVLAIVFYFLYLLNNEDIQQFVLDTLKFTNSSSVGHVLQWLEGIASIIQDPLGLGLGTSGRVAGSFGENVGGENQFIIIGVQAGIIAMSIYLIIYIKLISLTWRWWYKLKGKERQVGLTLLLIKIGVLIPFLTSELESSSYISYMTWFISGFFISIISEKNLRSYNKADNANLKQGT